MNFPALGTGLMSVITLIMISRLLMEKRPLWRRLIERTRPFSTHFNVKAVA